MNIYRLALYVGIGLLTVGITLFFVDSPRGILGQADFDSPQDIEAYAIAENASTQYFNEDGSLSYTFNSSKLSHFRPTANPENSYTAVEKPLIVVFDDDRPWHITSSNGHVSADRMITLNQDVELTHEGIDGRISTLHTSELIFDTSNKLAYTERAVTIKSSLGVVTATGMRADLTKKNIKLLSKVRGRHTPQIMTK